MKALLVTALLASAPALAQQKLQPANNPERWAAGFLLGDPFGLSLKRYAGGAKAFDLYAALAYGPGFRFGGDYLVTLGRLAHTPKVDLDIYAGAGPFIGVLQGPCFGAFACGSGDVYFGARVPFGAEAILREVPITLGAEIAPGFGIAPGRFGFLLDFLLAVRFLL